MLPTLYKLCLLRTAELLKSLYWHTDCNPFLLFPSSIVDELITCVIESSTSKSLRRSDLQLLVKSGRVRNFTFHLDCGHQFIDDENINNIFEDLASECSDMESIKVSLIKVMDSQRSNIVIPALDILLSKARKVKSVESSVKFDLKALCNASHLETLILNFSPGETILDFLKNDGELNFHNSLKYIYWETEGTDKDYLYRAALLKYCPELTYIEGDLSKSLEHLHVNARHSGSLTQVYKLKKLFLDFYNFNTASANDLINFSTLTCPFVEDLKVEVVYDHTVPSLKAFSNVTCLRIFRSENFYGDYTKGIKILLENPEFGHKLKTLELVGFADVDLSSVNMCCPNLEHVSLECQIAHTFSEILPNSYQNLKDFKIWILNEGEFKLDPLVSIVRNAASHLELLTIIIPGKPKNHPALEDMISEIMLPKLRQLHIRGCEFSTRSMKYLLANSPALARVIFPRTKSQHALSIIARNVGSKVHVQICG